ncbi:Dipeptidyl aminopeptidase-like protein 6, partial [Armadillidium nasatum]
QLEPVTPFPSPSRKPELLQLAQWVPNSEALIMVHENDIYYRRSPIASEVIRLTNTGKRDEIFNGITDHLYREYILHKTEALWVSPDQTYLCYATFNDSMVKTVDTANPVATLWVIKLENLSTTDEIEKKDLKPPTRVKDESVRVWFVVTFWDHYFTDAKWIDEESISVVWRNRHQNISVATLCTSPLWFCKEVN